MMTVNPSDRNEATGSEGGSVRRRKRTVLTSINDVLNKVSNQLGLQRRLQEHTLMSLWPTMVGEVLARKSRPLFIDADRNFVVTVADAAIGQELSLLKPQILSRLCSTARSLGIEIKGFRLDLKYFHSAREQVALENHAASRFPHPTEVDIAAVKLNAFELEQIEELREKLDSRKSVSHSQGPEVIKGLDETIEWAPENAEPPDNHELRTERFLKVFETGMRLRRWQIENGYPVCTQCGNPTTTLNRLNEQIVCIPCFYANT